MAHTVTEPILEEVGNWLQQKTAGHTEVVRADKSNRLGHVLGESDNEGEGVEGEEEQKRPPLQGEVGELAA